MKKKIAAMIAAAAMALTISMPVLAAKWVWTGLAYRYYYDANNSQYYRGGWQWIDDDKDGIAECYYFDEAGYLETGTTTPDGYKVNEDGAWIENGMVQTRQLTEAEQAADMAGSTPSLTVDLEDDTYNKYGINKSAYEMLFQTREENAKYGEVSETVKYGYAHIVTYANGFEVKYEDPSVATWAERHKGTARSLTISPSRTDLDNTWLIKFFYPNRQPDRDRVADTAEKDAFMRDMGFNVTSSIPPTFDHVSWEIEHGEDILKAYWYCDDRVTLLHDIPYKK